MTWFHDLAGLATKQSLVGRVDTRTNERMEVFLPPRVTRRSVLATLPAATALLSAIPAKATQGRSMANSEPRPFRINVPAERLDRIQGRLASAHFPSTSAGAGWRYGVDAEWFRHLVDYWREGYDW